MRGKSLLIHNKTEQKARTQMKHPLIGSSIAILAALMMFNAEAADLFDFVLNNRTTPDELRRLSVKEYQAKVIEMQKLTGYPKVLVQDADLKFTTVWLDADWWDGSILTWKDLPNPARLVVVEHFVKLKGRSLSEPARKEYALTIYTCMNSHSLTLSGLVANGVIEVPTRGNTIQDAAISCALHGMDIPKKSRE
jgi:hypothetical protein